VKGKLPDYNLTVRKGMPEYHRLISVSNEEEERVDATNRGLLQRVLTIAARVEPRADQMAFS